MSQQSNHYPESLDIPEGDDGQFEGTSLRDLSTTVRDLRSTGYSLKTILALVLIAAGEPPLPRLAAGHSAPPPF